jgi:hypothetical protein
MAFAGPCIRCSLRSGQRSDHGFPQTLFRGQISPFHFQWFQREAGFKVQTRARRGGRPCGQRQRHIRTGNTAGLRPGHGRTHWGTSMAYAQNSTIFGPNVYVFTPSDSVSTINATLNTLYANTQFSTNRYAVLFEPGTYTGVESEVGYYESVAGLGETPTATTISNGYLTSNQTDSNGNLTTNFRRSIENISINAVPSGDTYLQWGVSQGAAFRRMSTAHHPGCREDRWARCRNAQKMALRRRGPGIHRIPSPCSQ